MAKKIFKGKDKFITVNIGSIKGDDNHTEFIPRKDLAEQLELHLTKYGKKLLEERLKKENYESHSINKRIH